MSRRTYVQGYYRQDGTWVSGHYRRVPDHGRNTNKQPRSPMGYIPTQRQPAYKKMTTQQPKRNRQATPHQPEENLIKQAADFCYATITEDEISAASDKISERVADAAWKKLQRKWQPSRCAWLERLAQIILDTKSKIHETVADVVMLKRRTLLHRPEQIFAHQFIQSISLPGDEHFIASAYGIRLAGVSLCAIEDISLMECACFASLAKQFTREQVKEFLVAKGTDWMHGPTRQQR